MAKNNYWIIDGFDMRYEALWRAKSFLSNSTGRSLSDWYWRLIGIRKAEGNDQCDKEDTRLVGAIRHWVEDKEVSLVLIFEHGFLFYSKTMSVENAKKQGVYIEPIS